MGGGRKANAARRTVRWNPSAKVGGLDVPDPQEGGGVGGHRVEHGVAEADGVAAPAVEVLEVEAGAPPQRKSRLNPRPAVAGQSGQSARRSWTISA